MISQCVRSAFSHAVDGEDGIQIPHLPFIRIPGTSDLGIHTKDCRLGPKMLEPD